MLSLRLPAYPKTEKFTNQVTPVLLLEDAYFVVGEKNENLIHIGKNNRHKSVLFAHK